MDKESADFLVERFRFLNGKKITINSTQYNVQSVELEDSSDGPEPVVKCVETNNNSAAKTLPLDHHLRTNVSVLLAEVDSLQFDEKGRERMHVLLQDIYRKIPIEQSNFMILEKLKPHLGYWADWDESKDGTESFQKVKHLLLAELQDL